MKKKHVEDFMLKHLLLSEICTREICEECVYKHSETIDYVKKLAYFLRNLQTSELLGSRMRNL